MKEKMSNSIIPNILCLSLDKRKEHWQALQKHAESLGLNFTPFVCGDGTDTTLEYDQIDVVNPGVSRWGYGVEGHKHHHYNALLAHKGMIQRAKNNGWSSVLLMEDDAIFLKRFDDIISKIQHPAFNDSVEGGWVKYLEQFSLVYLGWWKGQETDDWNTGIEDSYKEFNAVSLHNIHPSEPVGGFHGVIVRSNLFDWILSLPMNNPLDSQINSNRRHIPSVLVCPKIIHTKDMYSQCEGTWLGRKKLEEE